MSEVNEKIRQLIKQLFDGGADVVLGWTLDETTGVATPARFNSPQEAQNAVFNSTCVHNLAVHLPRLKDRTAGIIAKGCDARSIAQLIAEREVEQGRVKVIGISGRGILNVKKIWRKFGYGVEIEDRGDSLAIGGNEVDRVDYLQRKCLGCRDAMPAGICEEIIKLSDAGPPDVPEELAGVPRDFEAMTPYERRRFWEEQFSRCIRCYACREVCPMCFCRDVCTMQTRVPHWAGGEVNARDSEMVQHIRVSHLAGRCTGCGECERACPAGIPLMLLLEEQNKAIEDMFGYRAGMDIHARPPLLTFNIDSDDWSEE